MDKTRYEHQRNERNLVPVKRMVKCRDLMTL